MATILVALGLLCLMIGLIVVLVNNRNPVVSVVSISLLVLSVIGIFKTMADATPKGSFNTVICISEKKCYYATVLVTAPYSQTNLREMTKANAWRDAVLLDDTTGLKLDF